MGPWCTPQMDTPCPRLSLHPRASAPYHPIAETMPIRIPAPLSSSNGPWHTSTTSSQRRLWPSDKGLIPRYDNCHTTCNLLHAPQQQRCCGVRLSCRPRLPRRTHSALIAPDFCVHKRQPARLRTAPSRSRACCTAFDIRIAIALDAVDQSAYLNRLMQTYEDVSVVCIYVLSTLLPDQHAEIGLRGRQCVIVDS